jgi:DNA polymerase-3 subunit epsilon
MSQREVAFDTETTGLYHNSGDRVIEIGCVELINHLPTGKTFHTYINPQRDVPLAASKVNGLTTEFLVDKPIFMHIVEPFLNFIGDSPLVIHNASFDMGFINAELERLCRPLIPFSRAIDTLKMARQKFPGSPANLDALCRRFNIDLSKRGTHSAILDAQLLANVYLELIGGRQTRFAFSDNTKKKEAQDQNKRASSPQTRPQRPSRNFQASPEELASHEKFLEGIKDPLWLKKTS